MFEIGSGSQLEIYVDSGTALIDCPFWAGITMVYGIIWLFMARIDCLLDGSKINTWTQYNGRLESSGTSHYRLSVPSGS